jgi:hypothetical protein
MIRPGGWWGPLQDGGDGPGMVADVVRLCRYWWIGEVGGSVTARMIGCRTWRRG